MKRSVEFDLLTKSEANLRFASRAGMFAKAGRVKTQREATRDELARSFGRPPPAHVVQLPGDVPRFAAVGSAIGLTVRHAIGVHLVRIAPHRLDDDNVRGALKAIRDEVAAWLGRDDGERELRFTYDQEQRGADVYRVRIEVTDKLAGDDVVIVRAEQASEGRKAKSRVKRAITASSSARKKAAASFSKLTGHACDPSATGKARIPGYHGPCNVDDMQRSTPKRRPDRDPGDEEHARDLAPCTTCRAALHEGCDRSVPGRTVFGVHVARARAAGLYVPEDDRGDVKPARAPRGARRVVPAASPASRPRSYALFAWEQTPCPKCGGDGHAQTITDPPIPCGTCHGTGRKGLVLAPLVRYDTVDAPESITIPVPSAHSTTYGDNATLHRRAFNSKTLGMIWLFEKRRESTT